MAKQDIGGRIYQMNLNFFFENNYVNGTLFVTQNHVDWVEICFSFNQKNSFSFRPMEISMTYVPHGKFHGPWKFTLLPIMGGHEIFHGVKVPYGSLDSHCSANN